MQDRIDRGFLGRIRGKFLELFQAHQKRDDGGRRADAECLLPVRTNAAGGADTQHTAGGLSESAHAPNAGLLPVAGAGEN